MKKIADVIFNSDSLRITGDLDFSNVMAVYEKALGKFSDYQELVFDFSTVISSDSAGLALMVEWVKQAKHQHKSITFKSISADIISLAKAAGLEQLIVK